MVMYFLSCNKYKVKNMHVWCLIHCNAVKNTKLVTPKQQPFCSAFFNIMPHPRLLQTFIVRWQNHNLLSAPATQVVAVLLRWGEDCGVPEADDCGVPEADDCGVPEADECGVPEVASSLCVGESPYKNP